MIHKTDEKHLSIFTRISCALHAYYTTKYKSLFIWNEFCLNFVFVFMLFRVYLLKADAVNMIVKITKCWVLQSNMLNGNNDNMK